MRSNTSLPLNLLTLKDTNLPEDKVYHTSSCSNIKVNGVVGQDSNLRVAKYR